MEAGAGGNACERHQYVFANVAQQADVGRMQGSPFAVVEVMAFPSYLKDPPGSDPAMILAVPKPNKSHDVTLRAITE